MKILHLSTSDIDGGAARAAFRLHKGLLMEDIESQMFVRSKHSDAESVISYTYPSGLSRVLYRITRNRIDQDFIKYKLSRPKGLEVFSDDRSCLKIGFNEQMPAADIYHYTGHPALLIFLISLKGLTNL